MAVFRTPPSEPAEYVAQLGRILRGEWDWHTAPVAVSEEAAKTTIADYSVHLAKAMRMTMITKHKLVLLLKFDDNVGWTDISFGALEYLTTLHAGKDTVEQSLADVRQYIDYVLKNNNVPLFPGHPQYNHQKAHAAEIFQWAPAHIHESPGTGLSADAQHSAKNGFIGEKYSKAKLLIPSKQHLALFEWLKEDQSRLEALLRETNSALLDPPDAAVERYMFGFRRHIASCMIDRPLADDLRIELAEKVLNQWEKIHGKKLGSAPNDMYKSLGIEDIFDTDDLRFVLDRLKELAGSRNDLLPQIEYACSQVIVKLSGEHKQTDEQKKILAEAVDFWSLYLKKNSMPMYEHREFGLACLAKMLRLDPKEQIVRHLGAFKEVRQCKI